MNVIDFSPFGEPVFLVRKSVVKAPFLFGQQTTSSDLGGVSFKVGHLSVHFGAHGLRGGGALCAAEAVEWI